jgi:magnesium-transporting ATPase (P-type)
MVFDITKIIASDKESALAEIDTKETGLTTETAKIRQREYGLNIIHAKKTKGWQIFLRQFVGNPLLIILAIATTVSYFMGQHISAYYIFLDDTRQYCFRVLERVFG